MLDQKSFFIQLGPDLGFGQKQNTELTMDHQQPSTTHYQKLFEGFKARDLVGFI